MTESELEVSACECSPNLSNINVVIISFKAPPPPLSLLSIKFHPSSTLTVNWNTPSETSNLRGYLFLVTGEDCGCESINVSVSTTSVSCSGWTARGQTCSFEVRTVSRDCGFISDPVNETALLKGKQPPYQHQFCAYMHAALIFVVPPAPTQLLVTFSVLQFEVEFMQPVSIKMRKYFIQIISC